MEPPITEQTSTPKEAPRPKREATTAIEEARTRTWEDSGNNPAEGLLDITRNLAGDPI